MENCPYMHIKLSVCIHVLHQTARHCVYMYYTRLHVSVYTCTTPDCTSLCIHVLHQTARQCVYMYYTRLHVIVYTCTTPDCTSLCIHVLHQTARQCVYMYYTRLHVSVYIMLSLQLSRARGTGDGLNHLRISFVRVYIN